MQIISENQAIKPFSMQENIFLDAEIQTKGLHLGSYASTAELTGVT